MSRRYCDHNNHCNIPTHRALAKLLTAMEQTESAAQAVVAMEDDHDHATPLYWTQIIADVRGLLWILTHCYSLVDAASTPCSHGKQARAEIEEERNRLMNLKGKVVAV